ncbi:MAG: alpha-1,4-glucan--maltose-1-phosphate maltosyltransferase [Bacteroidetes bacterium]|nr:alpha-1,4-glucan--maltose-1-phosphate maltosyltransferase [Bacteroidota bacterium]
MPLLHPFPDALPRTNAFTRVVLATLEPMLDGGRWPLRRSLGEPVDVVAGFVTDGHDRLRAELVADHPDGTQTVLPMPLRYNDEYVAAFVPAELGIHTFRVRAWIDTLGTWAEQFRRRLDGGETDALLEAEMTDLAQTLRRWAKPAPKRAAAPLVAYADRLDAGDRDAAFEPELAALADRFDPRTGLIVSDPQPVEVDPRLATFAAWYEFFPRSAADPGPDGRPQPGTLDDAARRLARVRELGFDIVYLPPISPIGVQYRKGKDGALVAEADEPGSPWAIGGFLNDGAKGGHTDVADELGGLPAFERFVAEADHLGLKVALDIAFQASPDHPWVDEHPDWFRHRPDGTIRYAENPPKKYQDVYPFDFESNDWPALWTALKGVFEAWIARGVRVFRVDNPHTKPFAFWAWCLAELKREHPDLIFLAEAFSRPRIMEALAKIGFSNSYTYFTWRLSKQDLTEYATELWHGDKAEFFRPNFWPNTPDIFHQTLADGGRPLHIARFVLAATLSPVYGIYGPPYEHPEQTRKHATKEEYADNEKFEFRTWNWRDPSSLQPLMRRVNEVRRAEAALQQGRNLRFLDIANDNVIAYVKQDGASRVLVVVNLNPFGDAGGMLHFDPASVGLDAYAPFVAHDTLSGETYRWQGTEHVVHLTPGRPAHLFVLRQG